MVLIEISSVNIPTTKGMDPRISPFLIARIAIAIPMMAGRTGITQINTTLHIIEIMIRNICGFHIRLPRNQTCLCGDTGSGFPLGDCGYTWWTTV